MKHSNIIYCLFFALSIPFKSFAQTYTPITPGSSFTCIQLPSGKAVIGKIVNGNAEVVDIKAFKAELNNKVKAAMARRRALTELKIDIKEDGAQKPVRMDKVIDSYRKFVNGIDDPNEEIPATKAEQLAIINEFIRNLKSIESSSSQQLKAGTRCIDNEPNEILPQGFLERDIIVADTGVTAVVYGPAKKYRDGITYCLRGDDKVNSSVVFKEDPCGFVGSFMSCKRKGYTGYAVTALVNPGGFLSEDAKIAAVQDVVSRSFAVYEVKEQTVNKNYTFKSCAEIFN